jgi:hypothetical protein
MTSTSSCRVPAALSLSRVAATSRVRNAINQKNSS